MKTPNELFIPFHSPSIGDEEIREVVAALRSGWLTTPSIIREARRRTGAAYVVLST